MILEYKEHFEMSEAELQERIEQFERQYYESLLLYNETTPEMKIYLNYIQQEIELCKKEIELRLRCIRKN